MPAPNGEAIIISDYTVTVSGSASVGKVTIQTGGTLALADGSSLTVRGRFDNQGGFQGPAGTLIFAGAGEHGLNASGPTVLGSLSIQSGAVLVEEPSEDYFSVLGQLDNQGTIRKSHTVSAAGRLSFGLTGAVVELTTAGTINKLWIDRVDQLSPGATYGAERYRLSAAVNWGVSLTQADSSPYLASLWLPHGLAGANAKAGTCQLYFITWNCGRTSSDNTTVRLDGISQLPGVWMVGEAKDLATIQWGGLNQVYDGHAKPVQVITEPAGLSVYLTYSGVDGTLYPTTKVPPVNAGTYRVQVAIVSGEYVGSAEDTLVISKANAGIQLDGISQPYDGSPKAVIVRTVPADLSVAITYQGTGYGPTSEPPSLPGRYTVSVQIDEANYQGEATETLIIRDAALFLPYVEKH